jgi:GrpB-like predicted nucleotidyltransferase (UPF0157 family)
MGLEAPFLSIYAYQSPPLLANWNHPPTMKVIIEPYNPAWVTTFLTLKSELETILKETPYKSIEHVGSTSIPQLAAKPVIDIDIVVALPEHIRPALDALTAGLPFPYVGTKGIPDRHVLRTFGADPARNIYVVLDDSIALKNHLAIRTFLREDAELRHEYGTVKLALAQKDFRDIDEYVEGKTEILQKILERAGVLSEEERKGIEEVNRRDVQVASRGENMEGNRRFGDVVEKES